MTRSMLLVCATLPLLADQAHADLIAYWNFNSYDGSATIIPSTLGSGTMTVTGFPDDDLQNFSGTTLNALSGDPAGNSLTVESSLNNFDFITLGFSMSGHNKLILSYSTRRTDTGFNRNQWSYSTTGTSFTSFGPVVNPPTTSTFGVVTRDFSSIASLNNANTVFLRYTLDGASNASGNNRIDNVQLNASASAAAPEPSTLISMAIGMLMLFVLARRVTAVHMAAQERATLRPVAPM